MTDVTTLRILADKALEVPCGPECVEWAASKLAEGRGGRYLAMLASVAPPYNHFELAELRDQALAEMGAPELEGDEAVRVYVAERFRLAFAEEADLLEVLREAKDICIQHDYLDSVYDFYLLYFAYDELQHRTQQHYWEGATRDNIERLIEERARALVTSV